MHAIMCSEESKTWKNQSVDEDLSSCSNQLISNLFYLI